MIGKLKMAAVLAGVLTTAGLSATASAREVGYGRGYERHMQHERAARWEHERREREWRRHERFYGPYGYRYYRW